MSTPILDRKDLKRPDAFLEKASAAMKYLTDNIRVVIAALGALLVVGAAFAVYTSMQSSKLEQANSALFNAKAKLTEVREKGPKPFSLNAAEVKPVIVQLEGVANQYPGTQPSFEAFMILGDTFFEQKDWNAAMNFYQKAVDSKQPGTLKNFALYALAFSKENAKDHDGAIAALNQILSSDEKALRADALMALARNYQSKGDKAKAAEQYNQVSKEFPNSALSKAAEAHKNTL
ncbi:MAG: tetratricopeptide repeat protein [Bdellovibrionota bacterium]